MSSQKRTEEEAPASGPGFKQPFLNLNADTANVGPVNTEIVGQIPTWLTGSLYRNGAGVFEVGSSRVDHLFDGFSVLHKFDLSQGKVTYTARVLDTESWKKCVKSDRMVVTQFGTARFPDPCKNIFSRMMTYTKESEQTDNTSVNIVEHGDRLYALTETHWMVRVDPDTLQTMDSENLAQSLSSHIAVHMSTAHPHFDAEGNMYNLGTCFAPPNNYNIIRIPPPQSKTDEATVDRAELLVSLPSRWMFHIAYSHSFGMSAKHFVVFEQPVVMHSLKMKFMDVLGRAPFHNFSKYPDKEFLFRVVNRTTKKETIKYCAEAAFTFHVVNCWESGEGEGAQLVVDLCGFSDLNVLDQLGLDNLDASGKVQASPTFRRYVLPLSLQGAKEGDNLVTLPNSGASAVLRKDGTVLLTPDYITEKGCRIELPRINYAWNTKKYRYVYGTKLFSETPGLVKLDLDKGEEKVWQEEGCCPGEAVFIASPHPAPGEEGEDDGVLLSPVLAETKDKGCFLLVLDAKTFKELGRAKTPNHVNMALTFHGSFVKE